MESSIFVHMYKMKNCTLALALGTAVVTTVLSLVAESAHALTFRFDGLRTDDDSFDLILTTEDTLITEALRYLV